MLLDHAPTDTIAAIATAPGKGGVGIIRISGPQAGQILQGITGKAVPPARQARRAWFIDAQRAPLDDGLVLWFPAPASYTGEDVAELQGHGGPVVLDLLLARCLALGARMARPGEFTERAFLNGQLDLAQAEAVADLIEAGSAQAARCAARSLAGEFSRRVEQLFEQLTALRVYVEAALDFPDEDIELLDHGGIGEGLRQTHDTLEALTRSAQQGKLLQEGIHLVIAGLPNAGKSSLLNALTQREAAIVTDIPGTTRDLVREWISLEGLPLHLVDTAGLRESSDPIEQEGIRRAWQAIEQADLVLLVIDDTAGEGVAEAAIRARLPARLPVLTVHNKIDLSGHPAGVCGERIYVSAKQHDSLHLLRERIKQQVGYEQRSNEGLFMARRRHLDALAHTHQHLKQADTHLHQHRVELLAEELRLAQEALGEITGRFTSDDLLGRIFSSFCIGK